MAQITGLYDKAQENIVGQIEKTFSAYVKGGAMNEKTAASLLTVRETEEAREALREQYQTATGQVKRDIWARLSAPAYANRISRLQALRDDIYAQARRVGLEEVEYVSDRLADTLEQSYYRTIFDVEQYTGEGYRFDLLGDNQITAALSVNWSGKNWSDRLWDNNQRFADAVEETVTVGLLAGLRYDEMRDNLLAVVGLDDTQGAKYNARRLVMTECSYVANQGHLMGYQAAGIEYYIYLATLDLRTSEICRELDGQRFPVAEAQAGTNLPPMHPHCRSTTMCDMSRGQLNRVNRAARDPVTGKSVTIPGYMTYREWYAKYVEGKNEVEKSGEDGILNEKDIRAIQDYMSSGVAYPLNDALRNGDTLTATQAQLVRNLDTALAKLPDYEGTVYRSVSTSMIDDPAAFLAQYQENNVVRSPAYTSTGKIVYDPDMEIQYVIMSKRGKDISSINVKEQEVLFKRNTKFIVERVDGKTIYMTEV